MAMSFCVIFHSRVKLLIHVDVFSTDQFVCSFWYRVLVDELREAIVDLRDDGLDQSLTTSGQIVQKCLVDFLMDDVDENHVVSIA
jgi:hypothetical protein